MANEDLLAKLTAAIDRLAVPIQPNTPQAAQAIQPVACGLPQPAAAVYAPMPGPMPAMQPVGVSFLVTIPLPDGREVSARVHFGPEAAANLQAAAGMAAQLFGPYLQARQPYRGGWGGGYSSYNGRSGRGRW